MCGREKPVKVCCHCRCSQLVTGIAAPPVGQWAPGSDLIGPGSETDGLFLEMIGSSSGGRKEKKKKRKKPTDLVTSMDLSHSLSLPAWCGCASVSEAAVFVNAFPPPRGKEGGKKKRLGSFTLKQWPPLLLRRPF